MAGKFSSSSVSEDGMALSQVVGRMEFEGVILERQNALTRGEEKFDPFKEVNRSLANK